MPLGFTWNSIAGRFIAPNGTFVSFADVRAALDTALLGSAADAAAIADAYQVGAIGIDEFERQMQIVIKDTQTYSTAVASGGFSNIGVDELATLTQKIDAQFTYLADWKAALIDGEVASGARMAMRAGMYASAARNTFDEIFRSGQVDRGFTEEKSILHPADHCEQCVDMSAIGWVDIGTLIPIGLRTCLTNCRCSIDYR